ncbi:MAG TPA: glycosyltransferase [Rhizomicrobium sp.]|jgi:glycosyltransferase involved in cell wall biosynthesis|nr:glycosyltransferase [Rhizomicrobium sp.]
MRIVVIIPTLGRAEIVKEAISRLLRQTRAPDRLLVVATTPNDVTGLAEYAPQVSVIYSQKGSCAQRNRGLDLSLGESDLTVIFDDDFVPADNYLAEAERFFSEQPEIVGATGRIIADGINSQGFKFEDADRLLAADASQPQPTDFYREEALYGCNMVFRSSQILDLRFDENLPLYGWQEDIDFTSQLRSRGRLVKNKRMAGVHLGVKMARSPGKRLGYSQVANPVYLVQKKTMTSRMARKLISRNFMANFARSFFPEPYVDRRGRLVGNMIGFLDVLLGRSDPRRILTLD